MKTKFLLLLALVAFVSAKPGPLDFLKFRNEQIHKFYSECANDDFKGPLTFSPCLMKAAKKLDQALEKFQNEHGKMEEEQEFRASPLCDKKQQVLFKNWLHQMRAKVYGGCAASILFPAARNACYGIAQGVLKAKVSQWQNSHCTPQEPLEQDFAASSSKKFDPKTCANQNEYKQFVKDTKAKLSASCNIGIFPNPAITAACYAVGAAHLQVQVQQWVKTKCRTTQYVEGCQKSDEFKNWQKDMRAKVYGRCAVNVSQGPASVALCYGVSAGILSSETAKWTKAHCKK